MVEKPKHRGLVAMTVHADAPAFALLRIDSYLVFNAQSTAKVISGRTLLQNVFGGDAESGEDFQGLVLITFCKLMIVGIVKLDDPELPF